MAQIKLTFDEYVNNPMGDRVMTNRAMYKDAYTSKFDKILLRENGKIEYFLYNSGEKYVIHFKIPSETLTGVYYDTVLEFTPRTNDAKVEGTLRHYNVRFFSNDRSFIFTYAYAFKAHGLLIDEFESKLGIAVKEKPVQTNPHLLIGYVKTFYFAYLVMQLKGLFNKVEFTKNKHAYSSSIVKAKVMSGQEKMEEYDTIKQQTIKTKRAARIHNKGEKIDFGDKSSTVTKTHVIQPIKAISKISPMKKLAKITSKVKRVKK